MNALPLRWWSSTALDAAAAAFAPAWQAWSAGWDRACGPVVAAHAFDQADDERLRMRWHRCPAGAAWLGVTATTPTELLGPLLFGAATDRGSMAASVAEAAWDDLLRSFGHVLQTVRGDAAATQDAAPPAAGWRAWSGAVQIRFAIDAADDPAFVLHLAAATATALLAPHAKSATTAPPPRIEPVEHAFARRSIRLVAELAGLQLDLGTLQSLRTGDVLTLQHRLDEPLRLCLPRSAVAPGAAIALCPVLLGARGGRRAVELMREPVPA